MEALNWNGDGKLFSQHFSGMENLSLSLSFPLPSTPWWWLQPADGRLTFILINTKFICFSLSLLLVRAQTVHKMVITYQEWEMHPVHSRVNSLWWWEEWWKNVHPRHRTQIYYTWLVMFRSPLHPSRPRLLSYFLCSSTSSPFALGKMAKKGFD